MITAVDTNVFLDVFVSDAPQPPYTVIPALLSVIPE